MDSHPLRVIPGVIRDGGRLSFESTESVSDETFWSVGRISPSVTLDVHGLSVPDAGVHNARS